MAVQHKVGSYNWSVSGVLEKQQGNWWERGRGK